MKILNVIEWIGVLATIPLAASGQIDSMNSALLIAVYARLGRMMIRIDGLGHSSADAEKGGRRG